MPLVGVLLGGLDLTNLSITVGDAAILYGNFIQAVVNFVIIALVIFLIVRSYNKRRREQEEETPPAEPVPAKEVQLFTEIRDLLRERS